MIVLAFVFAGGWFVTTAMAAHLPRLLEALGSTPAAAVAAGALIGPAQVGARLVEFGVLRRVSPHDLGAPRNRSASDRAACSCDFFGAPAAILFVILHGGGNGLLTIARGTLATRHVRRGRLRPSHRHHLAHPRASCRALRLFCSAWCSIGQGRSMRCCFRARSRRFRFPRAVLAACARAGPEAGPRAVVSSCLRVIPAGPRRFGR